MPGPDERVPADLDVARQKARILERVAPGVAHDLVNQVGGIQAFLGVIEASDARDRAMLEETANRAMATVKAFQDLVQARPTRRAAVPAASLVAEALALAAYPLGEVAVTVEVPHGLPHVEGDPARLQQAVLALLVSSMDALGWPVAHGSIRVSASATGRRVEIAIDDSGPPIPPEAAPTLFEATAVVAGRDPLDLAVARHLLRLDGGDVRYRPAAGGGNRFVLDLPAVGVDRAGGVDPTGAGEPASTRGEARAGIQVLVCDDEDAVRGLLVRLLRRAGLDAVEASSGPAALAILAARPVALVMADQQLGTMSGTELYDRAVELQPGLRGRFILVSGDPGDAGLAEFARRHGLRVLAKPFGDLAGLPDLVREAASA